MKKKYNPGQHIYRLLPCPSYDIACIENWLSDMAEKGLFLIKDGIFAGIATFEYNKPKKLKYRLEAAQKSTSMWADNNGDPDPEQIEISEKYSWEYIAKLKDFYIYRSFDLSSRELNTDPLVQALALNLVKKRHRSSVISSIIYLIIYPLILTKGCLLLTAISMGTWWTCLVFLLAALLLADEIRAYVHLKKVREELLTAGYYSSEVTGSNNIAAYHSRKAVRIILAIVLIIAFLNTLSASVGNERKVHLEDYKSAVPFATMSDFAGEGYSDYEYTMTGMGKGFNTIEERSDIIAPLCIEYNEHARIKRADGSFLDGGLYINYCELKNPVLAKLLEKEMLRSDKMKKGFKLIDSPALNADDVIAYNNELHWPTVIIRKNNIVVKAYFFQLSEYYTMSVEEWSGIICESIG